MAKNSFVAEVTGKRVRNETCNKNSKLPMRIYWGKELAGLKIRFSLCPRFINGRGWCHNNMGAQKL